MTEKSWDNYWYKENNLDYWQKPASSVLELIKRCDPSQQTKVLDLGCGIGRHALAFARAGFEVTAVDSSRQALKELNKYAKEVGLEVRTIKGDFTERLFTGDLFDIVVSYNVIYHGRKGDMAKSMGLCQGYLREQGLLFFTCPTRDDGKYGSGEEVELHTYKSLNSVHPGDIHYFSSQEDIEDFIKGFTLISINRDEHYWDNDGERQFSSYWEVLARKN